jgi:hypothetical protein
MAREIGSNWFDTAVEFDDFITPAVNAYYSVDGGVDILIETIYLEAYQESSGGATVTLYRGEFNGTIPPGAVGSTVVKIYNPSYPDDYLEYTTIEVVRPAVVQEKFYCISIVTTTLSMISRVS